MSARPAIDGWFTTGDAPALLGSRCTTCATTYFPPTSGFCRNPACDGDGFEAVELSRRGTVWSYTDAQYQPPAPYVSRTAALTAPVWPGAGPHPSRASGTSA